MEKLSIGRVVSETFGIIGRNLVSVGTVAVVISAVAVLLSHGVSESMGQEESSREAVGVAGLIAFVMQTIATGGITHAAVADQSGQRVSVGPAFATGLRLTLPLLGLGLVVGLGVGLASLLLVVPGILLWVRWTVAVPVRVVEGPSTSGSLQRSSELTLGSRWPLFWLAVLTLVFIAVIQVGAGLLAVLVGESGLASGLLEVAASAVNTGVSATGTAVCYMELRRIREGTTPDQLASVFT